MTKFMLGGRKRDISEPVFKHLRRIIAAYNQLAVEGTDADKAAAIDSLLDSLLGGAAGLKLKHLKDGELAALLQAVPAICGLTTVASGGKGSTTNWGDLYAHLSACLGWTYDYIDNYMTLSRLTEYQGYLAKHPPTHQLVAAFLGYEHQDQAAGNGFLKAIAAQAKNNRVSP